MVDEIRRVQVDLDAKSKFVEAGTEIKDTRTLVAALTEEIELSPEQEKAKQLKTSASLSKAARSDLVEEG